MLPGAKALLLTALKLLRTLSALALCFLVPCLASPEGPLEPAAIRELLAKDRWREALGAAERLAAEVPGDPDASAVLGEALYRAGRLDEAEARLSPLAGLEAAPARALVTLGLLRKAQGRGEEAAALVEKAVVRDPEDRHVVFWAADAAASNARAAELLEAYLRRSVGDDPDRIEAAKDALAFLRSLGERRVWIPVARPSELEVPLRPLGAAGRIRGYVVEANLGKGKPVRLLLDTGSSGLFLVERIARRCGAVPLSRGTTFGGGGGQRHTTESAILPSFAMGALRFKDALLRTTREEVEPTGQYQGVLGVQFLGGYRITLDLVRGRLGLTLAGGAPAGDPYYHVSGQLLVRAGVGSGPKRLFVLDTGAVVSIVSLSCVADVPGALLGSAAGVRGYGGRLGSARSVRGVRLEIQEAASADGLLAADLGLQSRLSGVEVSGFAGLDLLAAHRIVIDTVEQRVHVLPAGR